MFEKQRCFAVPVHHTRANEGATGGEPHGVESHKYSHGGDSVSDDLKSDVLRSRRMFATETKVKGSFLESQYDPPLEWLRSRCEVEERRETTLLVALKLPLPQRKARCCVLSTWRRASTSTFHISCHLLSWRASLVAVRLSPFCRPRSSESINVACLTCRGNGDVVGIQWPVNTLCWTVGFSRDTTWTWDTSHGMEENILGVSRW